MRFLRIPGRLAALIVLTAGVHGFLVLTSFLRGLVPGSGGWAGPATARWRAALFHRWARGARAVIGMKIDVQGPVPEPPFYLVSNHLSYVDVVLLASQLRCAFVAKAEVADWPILGGICRGGGTLFIDRANKRDIPRVTARIEQAVAAGRGIVVFPEGTSTKGDAVARFSPSLLEAAATEARPVSYATLSYSTPPGSVPAHLSVCWWGGMPFAGHLFSMLGLPEIRATLRFGAERIVDRDRKALTRRLQSAVEAQFRPVV